MLMLHSISRSSVRTCKLLAGVSTTPASWKQFSISSVARCMSALPRMKASSCKSYFESTYDKVNVPCEAPSHLIVRNMPKFGNRIALTNAPNGKSMTYNELYESITKFANGLKNKLGFGQGQTLAIMMPNLPEYFQGWFAPSLCGGIVTTVNPSCIAREIAFQLKDSKPSVILTSPTTHAVMIEALQDPSIADLAKAMRVVCVDEEYDMDSNDGSVLKPPKNTATLSSISEGESTEIPDVRIAPEDPMCILYSSGTTGLPKGVVLTHGNLMSNLLQLIFIEGVDKPQVYAGVLPFYHCFGLVVVLMVSCMKGDSVALMPKFDLANFFQMVETHKVTTAHIVPPIALGMAKHPIADNYDLSSLEIVFCAAAPLGAETQMALEKRFPFLIAKQGYGMTELSPAAIVAPNGESRPGSCGILLPNTEAKIVDIQTLKPVNIGEKGLLLIRGPQVMKHYLNREDATQQTIDKHGFLNTGDIAKVDEEGWFYIVDRQKELIKYKGNQVAPAEIEALLLTHPEILDAAVLPKPHEEAGEVPIAFVTCKEHSKLSEQEIVDFIAKQVAPYKKLRGGVVFEEAIPKSPSGKILRRFLKDRIPK
eukprot:Nk52_evm6s78 gene=Nk52_evmTU6s78